MALIWSQSLSPCVDPLVGVEGSIRTLKENLLWVQTQGLRMKPRMFSSHVGCDRTKVSGALTPFFNGSNRGAYFAWSRGELRAIVMFDGNDDAKCADRRVAVPVGSVRCRRWSAAEKAAVIRDTLEPGARISDMARRWQVEPQGEGTDRDRSPATHWRALRD